jgi:nucleoside-diphosphate-sugar epimerase
MILFSIAAAMTNGVRFSTRSFGPCGEVPTQPENILVIGAGGRTGREIMYQSLKNGHNVIGLTPSLKRESLRVPIGSAMRDGIDIHANILDLNDYDYSPKLNIVIGSVLDHQSLYDCFTKYGKISSVILALGGNPNHVGNNMLSHGTLNVLNYMRHKNCKKITAVTSVGIKESYFQAPIFFRNRIDTIYKDVFADKANQEYFLEKSDTSWCIVRPGGLTFDAPKKYVDVVPLREKIGTISRADLAGFCLRSVTDPEFRFFGKKISISNDNIRY